MSQPNLAILNANVFTGSLERAEAVAIAGERIVAVGTSRDIARFVGPHAEIIDAGGASLLPGFIDNHTHFMMGARQLLAVDLRTARSPGEFADRIAERAVALPAGRWLTGGNWDHEQWPHRTLPAKILIDPITPSTPVFVTRLDLHMGLANSAALALAGIDRFTPDPPGGLIERNGDGEPTGILKDTAMDIVLGVIPKPGADEEAVALKGALAHAAALGITSVQDVTSWDDWHTLQACHARGELTLRLYARTPIAQWREQLDWLAAHGPGDSWLRLGGVKGFVDGSLGSTTALFLQPYSDAPDAHGLLIHPPEELAALITAADAAELQLSIHAIGDAANHLLLDLYAAAAAKNGPRDRRARIEHAQHLTPADIRRFAALGVIASAQPYHAADDGRWADRRLGAERVKMAYPFRSLLDAGAGLTFGTDWPVAPLDPLLGIHAAVTRQTLDGSHPDGWVPEQKISLAEAIHAYTAASAFGEFAEQDKGRIAPGYLADLVLLDTDLFALPPADIAQARVACTVSGGKIIYRRPG
ncbi:MAG: amidohydrolase [Negativicutes bacterium]|nr:amidohydrolase [Negativicutes bacterium]